MAQTRTCASICSLTRVGGIARRLTSRRECSILSSMKSELQGFSLHQTSVFLPTWRGGSKVSVCVERLSPSDCRFEFDVPLDEAQSRKLDVSVKNNKMLYTRERKDIGMVCKTASVSRFGSLLHMIISKFYSSLVWTSDWVFKFMSAGDDRFFSGRFIQRNHTMVRNPGLQVLYSVKNTGLSLTGSEHLKCIFCIVLYMFFHMFVCVYIYVYKSLSYIHSVLLSTYIHTWQYYTCLGLSIQIIREFIY